MKYGTTLKTGGAKNRFRRRERIGAISMLEQASSGGLIGLKSYGKVNDH